MSTGIILQQVRNHLRSAMSLDVDQCGIQPGGRPPHSAGELYVAVDDGGTTSDARNHLHEQYRIEVAVWRRAGQHPADRLGDVQLPQDPYLEQLLTLDQLERQVIQHLHGDFANVTAAANAEAATGTPGGGDVFQLALYYVGRDKTESIDAVPSATASTEWLGRRLSFSGMDRIQATDVMA